MFGDRVFLSDPFRDKKKTWRWTHTHTSIVANCGGIFPNEESRAFPALERTVPFGPAVTPTQMLKDVQQWLETFCLFYFVLLNFYEHFLPIVARKPAASPLPALTDYALHRSCELLERHTAHGGHGQRGLGGSGEVDQRCTCSWEVPRRMGCNRSFMLFPWISALCDPFHYGWPLRDSHAAVTTLWRHFPPCPTWPPTRRALREAPRLLAGGSSGWGLCYCCSRPNQPAGEEMRQADSVFNKDMTLSTPLLEEIICSLLLKAINPCTTF